MPKKKPRSRANASTSRKKLKRSPSESFLKWMGASERALIVNSLLLDALDRCHPTQPHRDLSMAFLRHLLYIEAGIDVSGEEIFAHLCTFYNVEALEQDIEDDVENLEEVEFEVPDFETSEDEDGDNTPEKFSRGEGGRFQKKEEMPEKEIKSKREQWTESLVQDPYNPRLVAPVRAKRQLLNNAKGKCQSMEELAYRILAANQGMTMEEILQHVESRKEDMDDAYAKELIDSRWWKNDVRSTLLTSRLFQVDDNGVWKCDFPLPPNPIIQE